MQMQVRPLQLVVLDWIVQVGTSGFVQLRLQGADDNFGLECQSENCMKQP